MFQTGIIPNIYGANARIVQEQIFALHAAI